MFPQCKIKVSGLIPYAKYLMLVDFVPMDNFRYKVSTLNNRIYAVLSSLFEID